MNDRELLELAAKAVIQPGGWIKNEHEGLFSWQKPTDGGWNPLTDDGDALRLAVKLRIDVYTLPINAEAITVTAKHRLRSDLLRQPNPTSSTENLARDPYAATRRAIVRAAAEIGRQMQEGGK